jgi:hypothetical protein
MFRSGRCQGKKTVEMMTNRLAESAIALRHRLAMCIPGGGKDVQARPAGQVAFRNPSTWGLSKAVSASSM